MWLWYFLIILTFFIKDLTLFRTKSLSDTKWWGRGSAFVEKNKSSFVLAFIWVSLFDFVIGMFVLIPYVLVNNYSLMLQYFPVFLG